MTTIKNFACEIGDQGIVAGTRTMETNVDKHIAIICLKTCGDQKPNIQFGFVKENKIAISFKWEDKIS